MARVDKEYFQSVVQELREGLEEIGKITALSLDEFMRSRSLRFAMRYSVVLVVESAADLGVAILKQCFGEGAGSYREVFLKLAERGVISFRTAEGMASLASLRNMGSAQILEYRRRENIYSS
ncbi:DUF86 domain-containing protein [Infirmifilum sp. NZ]|uniref:DUF86 domain-containing protein n=1 Tax=Infirmifilum sp. NZ TaxID=2926850 RepID=UPI0027A263E0|nr:HepT-like ribonuclease domain-containing protein [Infirmifilum sp. NZ]UNQ73193.1 DUF86 domain-containing protein [Infirmifilum sp. NZ]